MTSRFEDFNEEEIQILASADIIFDDEPAERILINGEILAEECRGCGRYASAGTTIIHQPWCKYSIGNSALPPRTVNPLAPTPPTTPPTTTTTAPTATTPTTPAPTTKKLAPIPPGAGKAAWGKAKWIAIPAAALAIGEYADDVVRGIGEVDMIKGVTNLISGGDDKSDDTPTPETAAAPELTQEPAQPVHHTQERPGGGKTRAEFLQNVKENIRSRGSNPADRKPLIQNRLEAFKNRSSKTASVQGEIFICSDCRRMARTANIEHLATCKLAIDTRGAVLLQPPKVAPVAPAPTVTPATPVKTPYPGVIQRGPKGTSGYVKMPSTPGVGTAQPSVTNVTNKSKSFTWNAGDKTKMQVTNKPSPATKGIAKPKGPGISSTTKGIGSAAKGITKGLGVAALVGAGLEWGDDALRAIGDTQAAENLLGEDNTLKNLGGSDKQGWELAKKDQDTAANAVATGVKTVGDKLKEVFSNYSEEEIQILASTDKIFDEPITPVRDGYICYSCSTFSRTASIDHRDWCKHSNKITDEVIPIAGSILGGMAGGAVGSAVLPVGGTLVGGTAGAMAGGQAGMVVGDWIEKQIGETPDTATSAKKPTPAPSASAPTPAPVPAEPETTSTPAVPVSKDNKTPAKAQQSAHQQAVELAKDRPGADPKQIKRIEQRIKNRRS